MRQACFAGQPLYTGGILCQRKASQLVTRTEICRGFIGLAWAVAGCHWKERHCSLNQPFSRASGSINQIVWSVLGSMSLLFDMRGTAVYQLLAIIRTVKPHST